MYYLKNFDLKEYHLTTSEGWQDDYPKHWQDDSKERIKFLGSSEYPIPKDYKEV